MPTFALEIVDVTLMGPLYLDMAGTWCLSFGVDDAPLALASLSASRNPLITAPRQMAVRLEFRRQCTGATEPGRPG
jgi:hypothetical protein